MKRNIRISHRIFSTIIVGLLLLCAGTTWGETFTINCNTSSSDELFSVSGNGTQYDYDSRWTSYNLIKMNKGESITITNVTGVTITAISAQGVADNNSNQTVNFTISDGTTNVTTSSGSWNNRKTATSLTNKNFNSVSGLKHGVGQTYTITNNTSSSYNAGVRFVITYTPATPACVAPTSVGISGTQSYTEGGTISLTAAATGGTGTPSYQWYKGGTAAGNKITGATSATFSKASCTTGDGGDYYCEVSTGSTCSTFSAVYPVTVSPVPTTRTVYLNPNNYTNWSKGDERYAIYCFGSGDTWYDFTSFDAGCEGTLYKAEVDKKYTGYVICRMNGATTENNWDNKWDQTYDITAADGIFCKITGVSGNPEKATYTYENTPFNVCVSGTWLAFAGETITLTATSAGATHFQWYKSGTAEGDKIDGANSATYTKTSCTHSDGGTYYCKAWVSGHESDAKWSGAYGVRVPYLAIQTGGGGDRYDLDFVRANTSAETATCEIYRGVAWDYEMMVMDGVDARGNNGTMTSDNCTNWTMDQLNNSKWCRIQTTKEGTYHFTLSFSNSVYTPVKLSATYPPMAQRGGVKVYIENTPDMQARGWSNDKIYYRLGKGKYDDGDTRNWTSAQLMTLVPGTARYLYTTTPEWGDNFWVWHIANNAGWAASKTSIYKTKTGDSWAITESSNFHGDELTVDQTIILNSTSGGIGGDPMNDNCAFYGYTHTAGMLTHNASVGATTNGKIKVEYTHHDGTAHTSEDYAARVLDDLAHTCELTISAVPDNGYRCTSLQVNSADFASGTVHVLAADATITATFDHATYTVTLHPNEGTINSGNVTSYTHGTGATLPTDVTKGGLTFGGWYDNPGLTGSPVTSISTTDCGDKAYWAKWITCPATNSGEILYKFVVNSSVADGNICSSGHNPQSITTPTQLSTLIGGTLDGYITNNSSWNNLVFSGGGISHENNDRGVLILTLRCPIEEGDLIRFKSSSTSSSRYNYLRHTSYSTSDDQLTLNAIKTSTEPEMQQLVAPAAFDGKTDLFIVVGTRTTKITYFEIIRPCLVTLDAGTNGGTVNGNATKEHRGALNEDVALSHAFKDGFRFKGWFTAPTGGSPVGDVYSLTGNTTLYAQFEDCPENGTMYKFEVGTGLTNGSVTANNTSFEFNTSNYLTTLVGGTLTTAGSSASYVKIANTNSISLENSGAYLKVDMDCELEEGDVIKSTVGSSTVYVTTSTSRTSTMILEVGNLQQKEIPAALVGAKTLYLWKGNGNATVSYFEIIRPRRTTITLSAPYAFNNYTTTVVATYEQPMPAIQTMPQRSGYVFEGYFDAPDGAGTQYYDGLGYGTQNWDKDVSSCTLYASWKTPCDVAPTLTTIVPVTTIWDAKDVDMSLVHLTCDFDTTGIHYSLVSASEDIPGCTFTYFDERIFIQGTPAVGNTMVETHTITFTMSNDCSPAHTYTVDATIRIYPADRKARLAYIVTGTKDGAFNAYEADDETKSAELLTYLRQFYTVNCVNGYATKDAAALAAYYDDYDLLIVTDFLDTGEGYTNAIGTLIDKKPILSFEAYVAGSNGSNWHIGSNPKDPSPKNGVMKVLCAGHAIFGDAEGVEVINKPGGVSDTTVTVLNTPYNGKALQGFVINEAPDFIFLATVRDANNSRDLIVCCERQVVFPARLMLYGINFNEMDNLTPAGKVVMHQMIDYLLMTDETKVADCSLVFDNHAGDNLWSNPGNWAPGYNIIPTPYHPTRIIAECHVNIDNAHAGSVKVNAGRDEHNNPVDGKLIVKPYGGLTVAGLVAKVNDTRYASPTTIKAEDLLIESDNTGNGAFVYGNKESDVRATVEYYSLGENANTANPVWQYIGIPFQANQTAIKMYYAGWMCRWAEGTTDNLGGLWEWVENEDVLLPFEGYCITQNAKKTYTFSGKLNPPVTTTLNLDNRDADGYAFAANSWTAPIKIQEMADADFINTEKAIYIYHSGTYANWTVNGTPVSAVAPGAAATLPGQYAVIPIHSSPYLSGADSVIPSMQGFFVKTTGSDPKLNLVYNKVVYDAKYFKTSTQPMRAPSRTGSPEVMRLVVSGEQYGADQAYLLARSDFSESFEDGWDGRKIEGDADAPMMAVVKEDGEMAVAAVETANEHYLSFRAGRDSLYTFHFNYDGETIYLLDLETNQVTPIETDNTYSFFATNTTAVNRFLITDNPYRNNTTTDLNNGEGTNGEKANGVRKILIHNQLYILRGNTVYRADGRIADGKEVMP